MCCADAVCGVIKISSNATNVAHFVVSRFLVIFQNEFDSWFSICKVSGVYARSQIFWLKVFQHSRAYCIDYQSVANGYFVIFSTR